MLHKILQLISYLCIITYCISLSHKNKKPYLALFGVFFGVEAIRLSFLEAYIRTTPGLIIEVIEGGLFLIALTLLCIDKYKKVNPPEDSASL
ncbi:hypothetical protein [Clostridium manihotivorum]|uniref:Uncharacterized protein n=1 Tax=Clostridium manihotivorum TaxID=2320868 RepID=A0A3R5QW41_9CLOT|nr:hypothetical protein [Clostridium manihotivorum]QAA33671.1 hypothetical protein C1I91_19650 [Clostridium manihotivorum]